MQPDVVLGMGGYISFPGGLMAALLRYPLVIHEQNSVAGLANRVLARFTSAAGLPFDHGRFELEVERWPDDDLEEARRIARTGEGFLSRSPTVTGRSLHQERNAARSSRSCSPVQT